MGYGWLNVGSFFLGLLAWGLPVVILIRGDRIGKGTLKWGTAGSAAACAFSLWMQIVYNHHLVRIGDWSALEDTSYATAFVAGVLLLVTILLDGCVLIKSSVKRNREWYR